MVNNIFLLKILRFMVGICESPVVIGSTVTINQWFPPKEKGTATGLFLAGSKFGPLIVPPLCAWIITVWGWRYIFVFFAIPGLLLAIFWYLMVRNKPEESRFVNEQEVAYIREEQLPTTTQEAAAPVAPEFNYCWLDKLIRTKQVEELSCSKQVFRCWDIRVVDAQNGATTEEGAFALSRPLQAGAFNYTLNRDSDEDWYSHSDDIKQLYYGVSGGVLAHANGVTLGQPLNDTVVLVKAPGAKDAKVENQTGGRTDWRGYAVLPYATEYRENRVALDTNTLADNVDLDNAVANVVPTRGAIVRAEFKARVGIKLLMTLTHNNKPLPFGAMVTSESSQSSGIVADNGQVYLSGMPLAGKVQVKWGEEENAHCVANYQLPPESQQQLLTQLSAECR